MVLHILRQMSPLASLRSQLARALLALARTRAGGRLAALACARAARLLPVDRVAESPAALAFRHPAPQAPDHVVLVPKRYVASICALARGGRIEVLRDLVALGGTAAAAIGPGQRTLTINAGARQDVAQLHAHLLPVESARFLVERAGWTAHVQLDDGAALLQVLREAAERLGGCRRSVGGSLVIRGFVEGGELELLVSVASAPQTR